jgi:CRP-like cAMP-binding protein
MISAELKRFALLAEFSDEDREALADLLDVKDLRDGQRAFREGSHADGLVLLVEGSLKLMNRRHGDQLGTLTGPYHLGAASLFSIGKREVTAIAEGPCKLWLLPRAALSRLAEDAPTAAFRLAEAVAAELAGLTRQGLDALADMNRG